MNFNVDNISLFDLENCGITGNDSEEIICDQKSINNEIVEKILEASKNIACKNGIDEKYIQLYIRMKKDSISEISSYSVKLDKNQIVLIPFKCTCIKISRKMRNKINVPNDIQIKEIKSLPIISELRFKNLNENFFSLISDCTQYAIDNYKPLDHFGCCGKYLECSNEKKCLHDDIFYAKRCGHRKNLEAGRIFYGINRNIT